MPVVAHHAVCPECHELASDDSPLIRTQETDRQVVPQQSDGQVGRPQDPDSIIVNETEGVADEKAEGRLGTTELPPVASHPVPIDTRPLHQSHAVQSFNERGENTSMPSLEGETGTFKLTPRVSCIPGTPPTPNLLQNGCEEAYISGYKVAARPFSHSTESRTATANICDPNERYEQDSMRYEDESDVDDAMPDEGQDVVPNPILEVGRCRVPSVGRGCLFPGSLFRGKQTSGRSSYDVEVRILDVSFPTSTISGYLSISHLTETHPRLTTFFSGEIIGSTHGFLTGPAFYSAQATEPDDMRHWSRFEHFQKVKGDLKRPGLTMRDEASASASGVDEEKPFCFMRWKERFLVPDHKVRDISGASFAGFYYLQLDFDPPPPTVHRPAFSARRSSQSAPRPPPRARVQSTNLLSERSPSGVSATATRVPPSPTLPTSPGLPRQGSSNRTASASGKTGYALPLEPLPVLTGYYFHHVHNSEPFQELSLTWVPPRQGSSSLQMR